LAPSITIKERYNVDTREPIENLDCFELIDAFEKSRKRKSASPKAASKKAKSPEQVLKPAGFDRGLVTIRLNFFLLHL